MHSASWHRENGKMPGSQSRQHLEAENMLKPHGRFEYSAIIDRPKFTWPNGKKLAVYLALNLEHFSYGEGMGAKLAPSASPDVLNYAWREYGNRVGAWRMLSMFDKLDLPVSVLVNTSLYEHCPQLVKAFSDRGDEIVAHGYSNAFSQSDMAISEEREMIAQVSAAIKNHQGQLPKGWLSPWIAVSNDTPDLLAEQGYQYTLNWCHDDQPTWFKTTADKPFLSVPYPQELNDIPSIIGRHIEGDTFANMIIDQFDEMLEQSEQQPLVMGIALHAYITGQPFRLRHLRRALEHICKQRDSIWLCTAGDIAQHFGKVNQQ
jgi:peptidoglycan/xylan/chitin deacetylase (PgdA/CDA1 family)